jgi:L-asparaginase
VKKRIVIVATGGTIAGQAASSTETACYTSALLPIDRLIAAVPALQDIAAVSGEQLAQLDSADMTPAVWLALAARINALLADDAVDGVVVTHGTDTMEETAYFLNLIVRSAKPVVLVGALRPANVMSTDGPMNLYDAVLLAASPEAAGNGVLVSLNDTINCSRDVTKTNTALQDAFKAPELGYLGYIQAGRPHFYRRPARKHTCAAEFDLAGLTALPKVEIIYAYVGSDHTLADAAVAAGAKGIVYAGVGNGGIPAAVRDHLAALARRGIVIVRSTRVASGIVTRNSAVCDDDCRFIAADTLSPQKARVLLMLALTKTEDPAEIQRMFWEY